MEHSGEMVAVGRAVPNIFDQNWTASAPCCYSWFSASKICANITKSLN